MIPLIAIVGRPNAGKSTLFNRLVGRRMALVDDEPGVTRDRIYARLVFRDRLYHVLDTGGLEASPETDIARQMLDQTSFAMEEANAVIFLLDGKEGLLPSDNEVADILRKLEQPVFFAVNKIDAAKHEDRLADFYKLGVEKLFPLSAEHGTGIEDLMEAVSAEMPGEPVSEEDVPGGVPAVAVLGRPNTGKSTLINRLLGSERHLVNAEPGTTRDAVDSMVEIEGNKWLFIDTAGIRRRSKVKRKLEKLSVIMALKGLERCDLALLMLDSMEGATEQDARIASYIHERGRAVIVLLNKWDTIVKDEEKMNRALDSVKRRLPHLDYAPTLHVSAKTGMGINKLTPAMAGVLEAYSKRVNTSELNRFLEDAVSRHSPPGYRGRPVKLYYITQVSSRPPTFVISVNRPEGVKESYTRYITNRLRQEYGFEGAPIRLLFRKHREKKKKK